MTVSDIQRWDVDMHGSMFESDDGPLVFHADHVAAVAAAQREGANQGYLNGAATNADNSFKAGVKAARDAAEVALLGTLQTTRDRVIAAIDALLKEKP